MTLGDVIRRSLVQHPAQSMVSYETNKQSTGAHVWQRVDSQERDQ